MAEDDRAQLGAKVGGTAPTVRSNDPIGELLVTIDRTVRRLEKRTQAILGDLKRGEEAQEEAQAARAFVPGAARAPRGTRRLVVTDWSSGEPVNRELLLQPDKQPLEQIEAIFARGRRLKRGAVIASQRLAETQEKLARLARLRETALAAESPRELALAIAAARRDDPALLPAPRNPNVSPKTREAPRLPYRAFVSQTGARILVGRGASDNDELTLHIARPRDLWLHARGQAGAHVVVPLKKGHGAPADLLVDAAHLAAHFSEARGESLVEVTYVPRRYVRKPRGSAPGLVSVDREKSLVLRVDPARLALLLAREEGLAGK